LIIIKKLPSPDVNPTNQLGSGITIDLVSGNPDNISALLLKS